MNSGHRIAAVTYVMRELLDQRLTAAPGLGNVDTTLKPPDKLDLIKSELNLFLYHVTPNAGWRNMNLPSVNSSGERLTNPPLGLDLHYLLIASGKDQLESELLLGYSMQVLHEQSMLSRKTIRKFLAAAPAEYKSSGLEDQIELIKVTPETLSIEDISKLWAAFGAKYRPSAAYKATVVLIESNLPAKSPLPVKDRKIYLTPFHQPVIEKILSKSPAGAHAVEGHEILSGYTLVLSGKRLDSQLVDVSIEDTVISKGTAGMTVSNSEISFVIGNRIRAGLHSVRVVHPMLMGSPPTPHEGVTSSAQAFLLHPRIDGNPGISGGNMEIKVIPDIGESQRVAVILSPAPIGSPVDRPSYTMQVPRPVPSSPPTSYNVIKLPVAGIRAGRYLVRVKVDDGESSLTPDGNGIYASPLIVIP